MFGRAYSEQFYVPLMSPSLLGGPYMFVRDCFEGIVLVCVLVLMARWAITRPMRLMGFPPAENRQRAHHHWEAYLILSCIGIIVSSGPVYDASRLVLHAGEPGIAGEGAWEPLSNHVVRPLLAGMAPGFVATAGGVAWWAHNLSVLVMLNFLPLAKHFHVITSLPNVFFRKLEPLGALSKQDLENATTFGASHIDQFTWKQVLDMFSCTECGRCSSQCPATATGKPLAPRQLLLDLRDYLYATQAFARLLAKAGVDFACLGKEEPCNGETARRLGNEYLYQTMAQACVESLNAAGAKKVIVNCPHCFNTIKNEFPQFGGHYEVIHAAELVAQLVAAGRLQVPPEFKKRTVYHDSCYYGRFNEIYDEPRSVLAQTGARVQEMHRHKQFGMCCGAGGGRMWIEEDPDKRVNLLRTQQALETDPEVIAVSCPFCMTMLSDGIKAKELEDKVQTLDVMEIVAKVAT